MFPKDLLRHSGDFLRQWRNHKWERRDDGAILFTQAKASIGGFFTHADGSVDHNTWTDEGMDYMLNAALKGAAREAGIFIAPFGNAFAPSRTLKAAQFPALAGEIVSPTEGYSESARQAWTPGVPSNGTLSNSAARAQITVVTASALTVRGAALLTRQAKGATDGVLLAAARFANDRTAYNGDPFPLEYTLQLLPS